MGENIENQTGLFIGLSSVPIYSNKNFEVANFRENIINNTFTKFREELIRNLENGELLDDDLYKPINFYAFGFFNLITFSFIDDFHFGNFSFRPYNRYIGEKYIDDSNFQLQVVNGYNIKYDAFKNLKVNLENSPFVSVCKLKINSALIIGAGYKTIKTVINKLKRDFCDEKCNIIITECFSWHEITLVLLSDSLSPMMDRIQDLRMLTTGDFDFDDNLMKGSLANLINENELQGINVFADTQSVFGINPGFFNGKFEVDTQFYRNYKALCDKSDADSKIKISTKIQMKTGHACNFYNTLNSENLTKELRDSVNKIIDLETFNVTTGRSDFNLRYKEDNSILNYIKFWELVMSEDVIKEAVFSNVRKLHSNINSTFVDNPPKNRLNTTLHQNLFQTLRFEGVIIRRIEEGLQRLKVSKEIGNSVLTLYTNFNDIICDVNLYCYYIDLKPILNNLKNIILELSKDSILEKEVQENLKNKMFSEENLFQYRRVSEISKMLLLYIRGFQTAYENRFLDSKKNGYNLDAKGEFNGGVHQIIHAYDSLFKITSESLRIGNDEFAKDSLPIASFGDFEHGIKASINNLHLNYFQLFQPEFFLFSVVKESINMLLDYSWFEKAMEDKDFGGIESDELLELGKLREEIARSIHTERDPHISNLLFEYLPPRMIKEKINYFLYYSTFKELIWTEKTDDIETFTFWLWNVYTQTSNLYNIDGSLRIDSFKNHFFAYYVSLRHSNYDNDSISDVLEKVIRSPILKFYIFDDKSNVLKECNDLYNHLYKNVKKYKIVTLLSEFNRHTSLIKRSAQKNQFYSDTIELIKNSMSLFKRHILDSDEESITSYLRNSHTGQGINTDKINYSKAVFDPHGGLFVREPNLRKEILGERIKIINRARDIGYKYKIKFFMQDLEDFSKNK